MKQHYLKNLIFTLVLLASLGGYAQQTICVGAVKNYSVNTPGSGPAGSTYSWVVTPNTFAGTITGTPGVNANSITINWGTTPAGVYTLQVTETNAAGCPGTPVDLTVTIENIPVNPTVTTVQPTCAVGTGSITVNTPVGTGLTYSIDGTNYQAGTGFNNLAPGTYNVTVKNAAGCISGITPVTINAQPALPAAPTATLTQPTCAVATGTITVTAPVGTGYEYSIDGTNYQTGVAFNNVAPGSYNLTVKNPAGCISSPMAITINAQPAAPTAPTVTPTQPTCAQALGAIQVTAPLGAGLTYSIDGVNYQAGTTFNNLTPGNYNVTVQSAGGCTSGATAVTINPQPAAPTTSAIIFN